MGDNSTITNADWPHILKDWRDQETSGLGWILGILEIITKDKEIELETTIAKLVDADEFTNVTQSKSQI